MYVLYIVYKFEIIIQNSNLFIQHELNKCTDKQNVYK